MTAEHHGEQSPTSIPGSAVSGDVDEMHALVPTRGSRGHDLVDRYSRQGRTHGVLNLLADDDEPWTMSLTPRERTKLATYLADLQRAVFEVLPAHQPGVSVEQVRHALDDDAAASTVRRALDTLVMAGSAVREQESDDPALYHRVPADHHSTSPSR